MEQDYFEQGGHLPLGVVGSGDWTRLVECLGACSDEQLRARLTEQVRRFGIKFRTRAEFDRVGWSAPPTPRVEKFYRVQGAGIAVHRAPFIWDLREALLRDDTLLVTSILMHRRIQARNARYLVGLETAAIPLISGILVVNALLTPSRPLDAAYLRKQRKADGLRRLLEGARIPPQSRLIVVDDILNKGVRKKQIVDYCRFNRFNIECFLVVVDAQHGSSLRLRSSHCVESLLVKSEIFCPSADLRKEV